MPTLSNEAEELHALFTKLQSFSNRGGVSDTLASFFQIEGNTPEYYVLLSAILARLNRLRSIAEGSALIVRHKNVVFQGIDSLSNLFAPPFSQNAWEDRKNAFISSQALSALDLLSSSLSNSIPVNVLSPDELKDYVTKIERAAKDLGELGDPLSALLATTLRTSARMMEKVEIYGSTAVGDRLFEVLSLLNSGEKLANKEARKTYSAAFGVVALALSGFIFFDNSLTAVSNTYTRVLEAAKYLDFVKPPEVRMLPAPDEADGPIR
jgi:hypothetical protein